MPDKISGRECQSEPLSPTESNGKFALSSFLFHYKNHNYNIWGAFFLQTMECMYLGLKKKNVRGRGGLGQLKDVIAYLAANKFLFYY